MSGGDSQSGAPPDPSRFVTQIPVQVLRLPHAKGLALPAGATAGSSGFDLPAALESPLELAPGQRELLPTGLVIAIPEGYEGQIRPRSGLALRHGITIPNSPGMN